MRAIVDSADLGTCRAMQAAALSAVSNMRIVNALNKASANLMIADADNTILFMNETMAAMMRRNEGELRKSLPQLDVATMVGSSIDVFHTSPAHQRGMLAALQTTLRTQIKIGPLYFALIANPILDGQGKRLGTVVEWLDRTGEVAAEQELTAVVSSAAQGDFSQRLSLEGKSGFFEVMATELNQLLQTSESGLNDVADLLGAFAAENDIDIANAPVQDKSMDHPKALDAEWIVLLEGADPASTAAAARASFKLTALKRFGVVKAPVVGTYRLLYGNDR